jgi:hypothetical protein
MENKIKKNLDIFTLLLAGLAFYGALVYRFSSLKLPNILLIVLLTIFSAYIIAYFFKKINNLKEKRPSPEATQAIASNSKIRLITAVALSLFLLLNFLILFKSRESLTIISPWQNIQPSFFYFFFISGLLLSALFLLKSKLSLIFVIAFTFLINSIAIIVYKFGFGFDFFIHEATMELISQQGLVEPKPFYYTGLYSIVIIFHKLFLIPIYYIHLLLVPLLTTLLIPINLKGLLEKYFPENKHLYFGLLFLIILPLGIFFNTTPQNLAFLFLLLVIIRGLDYRAHLDLVYILALSLAAIVTQPIAGIPAMLLTLAIATSTFGPVYLKTHLHRLIFILAGIALPGAFIIFNRLNNSLGDSPAESESVFSWSKIFDQLTLKAPNQENVVLNFIYFFDKNLFLFLIMILSGIYLAYKKYKQFEVFYIYLYLSLGFFISFLITRGLSFGFLVEHERQDYAERILGVALFFLLPFFIIVLMEVLWSISQKNRTVQTIFLVFFLLLIPTFLYLNYPRLDNYHNSHGYSMGQDDIDAVRFIENDANQDYIVLANQQTSVAALKEYGFTRYYKTDNNESVFYYPIPTGGPLYPFFLSMVNDRPERSTMLSAMELAGVEIGYLTISKYWWASSKLIDEAKLEASSWSSINEGNIHIFKFVK